MNFHLRKILFLTFSVLSILGYGFFVFAAPPGPGGYNPGETLDPECTPGQLVPEPCIVQLSSGGSFTADNGLTITGSNVQLGGTLLQDTVIDQDGFNQEFLNGNFKVQKMLTNNLYTGFENGDDVLGTGLNGNILYSMPESSFNPSLGLMALYMDYQNQEMVLTSSDYANNKYSNIGFAGFSQIEIQARENDLNSRTIFDPGITTFNASDNSLNNSAGIELNHSGGISFNFSNSNIGSSYTFPRIDGTVGQVLATDGSGVISWQNAGGSGWSLTGDAGTTAGTNFIGTTDATDFMVKTNGNQVALFGQNGNVAIGSAIVGFGIPAPSAPALGSIAIGPGANASGLASIALGANGTASGITSVVIGSATASGDGAFAIGRNSTVLASGNDSIAFGGVGTIASGNDSIAFIKNAQSLGVTSVAIGESTSAYSYGENVIGYYNSQYTPASATSFFGSIAGFDRQFSIGNGAGVGSEHNAYTLWKDGSFAYNDDNFQNDNIGTEQNMFYFNYGNHDGAGSAQTKRAIRLGSVTNDEWDITSANVGDRSIALGFGEGIASGENTFAFGNAIAEGDNSVAFNQGYAQGQESFAWGKDAVASGNTSFAFSTGNYATASGSESWALGSGVNASGDYSKSFGLSTSANSFAETVLGLYNTNYVANDPAFSDSADRLFNIGNGTGFGSESDALTILKSGQTGIGIDNFEANTNGNIFQVGDGSTNIIGYVDDTTGNWVAVSDEHKKDNITDLSYGLNELIQLRPTSFNYKRNGEHTIGFLAQQVLPIIPEAVYGTESEGYGMSYATLTPVIVKAIQEMNLKITDIGDMETPNTWRDAMIEWFGNVENGITDLYVKTFHADRGEFREEICLGQQGNQTCVTKDQLDQLLLNSGTVIAPTNNEIVTDDDSNPVIDPVIDESSDNNQEAPVDNSTSESGSENTEVTE